MVIDHKVLAGLDVAPTGLKDKFFLVLIIPGIVHKIFYPNKFVCQGFDVKNIFLSFYFYGSAVSIVSFHMLQEAAVLAPGVRAWNNIGHYKNCRGFFDRWALQGYFNPVVAHVNKVDGIAVCILPEGKATDKCENNC